MLAAYNELVPAFERLFEREGRDFARFYAEVKRLAALPKEQRRATLPPSNRRSERTVPDINIHREHALGLAKARKVAWKWAEQVEQKFDMECTVIEGDDERHRRVQPRRRQRHS